MDQVIFGIDIGGTSMKIGLFETSGRRIAKSAIPTRKDPEGLLFLRDLADELKREMHQYGLTQEQIRGAGMGVPGAVHNGKLVRKLTNIGTGIPDLAGRLSELSGIRNVRMGNDANVAALGEMWQGAGRGFEDLVMVTLGTGVGGGIILDGRILEGTFGAAGEIGHIKVNPFEQEVCGCGKRGCLEQYASASGMVRMAEQLLAYGKLEESERPADPMRMTGPGNVPAQPAAVIRDAADVFLPALSLRQKQTMAAESSLNDVEELSAREICDAARAGDPLGKTVLLCASDALGRALAAVSGVVDPQVFLIGGGVAAAGSILFDAVRECYRNYAFPASEHTKILPAQLGNDAGMYGAAHLVLGKNA